MAYTTLNSLLTAIAEAIRNKKGTTAQINAQNFPSEINNITLATGNAGTGDVLSGKTFSNSNGNGLNGAMPNRESWGTTINPSGSVTIPEGYHNGSGKVSATNNFFINNANLIFRGGNGEGHATSYRTTTQYNNLLVAYARGEINVNGTYDKRINLGNIQEAGVSINDISIYVNVRSGTLFTNPSFNASVTNGGLIIYALY